MKFLITWRHWDGSLVEFSEIGWRSADPEKSDWLLRMSSLCSTAPAIPPLIRMWLEENCELIDLQGSPDLFDSKLPPPQRESHIEQSGTSGAATESRGRRNSSKRYCN
jgi:hypothetical protein